LVGSGFIPKLRICRSLVIIEITIRKSSKKQKVIVLKRIFMRCLLPLRKKEKNKNMQAVAQLNTCNSNYYSTDIAVSLDDKYVGVVIRQNNDKSVKPIIDEIPECKVMMISSPSIDKRMILN
jgi:hypothetical protein